VSLVAGRRGVNPHGGVAISNPNVGLLRNGKKRIAGVSGGGKEKQVKDGGKRGTSGFTNLNKEKTCN